MSSFEDDNAAERSRHDSECGVEPLMNEYQEDLWRRRGCICVRLERRAVRAVLEWVSGGEAVDAGMTVGQVRHHTAEFEADALKRGYLLGPQHAYMAVRKPELATLQVDAVLGPDPAPTQPDDDAFQNDQADGEGGE